MIFENQTRCIYHGNINFAFFYKWIICSWILVHRCGHCGYVLTSSRICKSVGVVDSLWRKP